MMKYIKDKNPNVLLPIIVIIIILLLITTVCLIYGIALRSKLSGVYDEGIESVMSENYSQAIENFESLGDYKEGPEFIKVANSLIKFGDAKQLFDNAKYDEAVLLLEELDREYDEIVSIAKELDEKYAELGLETEAPDKTVVDRVKEIKDCYLQAQFEQADELLKSGNYEEASEIFIRLKLAGYEDDDLYIAKAILPKIEEIQKSVYEEAKELLVNGQYDEAADVFTKLKEFEDSKELLERCSICADLKQSQIHTIAAGFSFSAGITSEGEVRLAGILWRPEGSEEDVECGGTQGEPSQIDFSGWNDIKSVAAGNIYAIGLREDGRAKVTGKSPLADALYVGDWSDLVAVDAGERFVVGLKSDGSVVGTGNEGSGQIDFSSWENIVAITAGFKQTVGIDIYGNILCTDGVSDAIRNDIKNNPLWKSVIAIDYGGGSGYREDGHLVGLLKDGTVIAAGDNRRGQCTFNSDDWHDIIAISAGQFHTVGLREDGKVVSTVPWENPECSAVSDFENVKAIAAGTDITLVLQVAEPAEPAEPDGVVTARSYKNNNVMKSANTWPKMKLPNS